MHIRQTLIRALALALTLLLVLGSTFLPWLYRKQA